MAISCTLTRELERFLVIGYSLRVSVCGSCDYPALALSEAKSELKICSASRICLSRFGQDLVGCKELVSRFATPWNGKSAKWILDSVRVRSKEAGGMSTIEKHAFQAEIAQLLDIVVHSLYTDKEIFIRELISNATDATEKLRFLQTSGADIFESDRLLTIAVGTDDSAHTISIADAGVGMTRDELIENLGTIAHSGSKAFLQQIRENAGNPSFIGQFGVGFYSAFMVGAKVTVYTRS